MDDFDDFLEQTEKRKSCTEWICERINLVILCVACLAAVAPRLITIARYENVVHEYDPNFNYRATQYLVQNGLYAFHNWFDDRSWYPLGRPVGATVYPGLMWTAGALYSFMDAIGFPISVRSACVFVPVVFAVLTVILTYKLTKMLFSDLVASIAAMLVAVVPGYMSRSVAGAFDNECVSIFAMLLVFYFWICAVRTGSMLDSAKCALAYFYMASCWGGYVYIINLIPLSAFITVLLGRYSYRLLVAYSTFYFLGILLSMQIQFVSFMPVQSGEHLAAFLTFIGLLGFHFLKPIYDKHRKGLSKKQYYVFLGKCALVLIGLVVIALGFLLILERSGYLTGWTGRFYNLLHPSYAKDHLPLITSVSEHQPFTWLGQLKHSHILFFMILPGCVLIIEKFHIEDLQLRNSLHYRRQMINSNQDPANIRIFTRYALQMINHMKSLNDGIIFFLVYACTSVYFASEMIRLDLVFSPALCILSACCLESLFVSSYNLLTTKPDSQQSVHEEISELQAFEQKLTRRCPNLFRCCAPIAFFLFAVLMAYFFAMHAIDLASNAYSNPQIVMKWKQRDGGNTSYVTVDDFREAYSWLRHNTETNARVMSWWDYGYQLTAVANRTVIVDNNTWNNSHIAMVGRTFAQNESAAFASCQVLGVDYILLLYGGHTAYGNDDINKFHWMLQISSREFPEIIPEEYTSENAAFLSTDPSTFPPTIPTIPAQRQNIQRSLSIDHKAPQKFLDSILYRMVYYGYDQLGTPHQMAGNETAAHAQRVLAYDYNRKEAITNQGYPFVHFEEAYTTERQIVRIFRVKKTPISF
ncbi:putative Dolichyl-diphosphooligosaccharide--protein glycosyltransferase subunit STT3A [Blattamonas nauphoetae]|uniref:dolichyl-diphosphooligosaccharide--protein glycotransferase n=1 Tax=Blattamonas nauphoetae TaxID=2049346 RepID=A0ABQ9YEF8_9EUKA|nr:putative Dolichyl-diphosphooligosaccharide--protein glycosyltransferase subunit STT3A [Blattamonas nauphoetae]